MTSGTCYNIKTIAVKECGDKYLTLTKHRRTASIQINIDRQDISDIKTETIQLLFPPVGVNQGGLEPLPILLCAANVSHFATYSITFSCGAEFCRFSRRCFLLEFRAIERKKVRCIFLLCRLCCYLPLRAKKRFATVENPHIFDEFI